MTNLDKIAAVEAWAASSLNDAGLLAAAKRCAGARAALTQNANVALTLEAALVDLVRLVPPPTTEEALPAR